MLTVTVYSTGPSCMRCTLTKKALAKEGVPFVEVDVRRTRTRVPTSPRTWATARPPCASSRTAPARTTGPAGPTTSSAWQNEQYCHPMQRAKRVRPRGRA